MFLYLLFAWLPPILADSVLMAPLDLSHFFDANTIYWMDNKPFDFTKMTYTNVYRDDFFYAANEFEAAEHGGTHMDAPYHFNQDGWKVGDIPVERFIGNAVYVNLRDKAAENSDYQVQPTDFEEWEAQHGAMPEDAIVLLDFGWSKKYNDKKKFFGTTDIYNHSAFHFPGLSKKAAQWLVDTGKVYGVGTDTASIDYGGMSYKFIAHRVLAKNSLFALEHVAFPVTGLPPRGYKILALPMKIREGTGAPCRVLALPTQLRDFDRF